MYIKHKILLISIITLLNLNIANGIGVEHNDDCNLSNYKCIEATIETNAYTPEEFMQLLNNNNLPNTAIIVKGDLEIKDSAIAILPDNLTVKGYIKLRNCNIITSLPKNITAYVIYIIKCLNLNNFGNTESPIAIN